MVVVLLNGNGTVKVIKVTLHWAGLALEWVTIRKNLARPTQPGHPPQLGTMSTGGGLAEATTEAQTVFYVAIHCLR